MPAIKGADSDWVKNPIDAFVLAGQRASGLRPLRRPTPGADPPRDVRFDRSAALPEADRSIRLPTAIRVHTRRWSSGCWLRLITASAGGGTGSTSSDSAKAKAMKPTCREPNAWPFRDYVIRAFNRDTPFPRFVLEQLAGDTLKRTGEICRRRVSERKRRK